MFIRNQHLWMEEDTCWPKGERKKLCENSRVKISVKFIGDQWSKAYWDILPEVREKPLYLLSLMLCNPILGF